MALISEGTKTASKTIKNISNILTNRILERKKISNKILNYKNRRYEIDVIVKKQNELFAITSIRTSGGSKRLALSQVGGSFLSRILQFAGFVTSGWLLTNMPTWIAGAKELSNRITSLNSTFSGFVDNIWNMIYDIGRVSTALFENLKTFDLTDSSDRIRNSLIELTGTLDSMGDQIKEAFSVLTEPFMNVPPLGTEAGPGAYPDLEPQRPEQPTQPQQPSGGNADFWTLVAIVSREDSDPQGQADVAQSIYNRASSGAYGSKNIRELILREGQYEPTWQRPKPGKKNKPNPEWFSIKDAKSAAKATGFTESAIKNVASNITNPTLQKNAAEFVQGRTDFKGANVGRPPSIQRKSGDNWFGWEYRYKGKSVASVPNLGVTSSQTPQPSSQTPQPVQVQASPMIVTSGYGWRWGRQHMGIDIVPKQGKVAGTPVILKKGGVIEYAYIDGRNMGMVLVTHDDGTQSRYLHVNNFKVKKGERVQSGKTIAYLSDMGAPGIGNATGPHLHFEYYKNKSSPYSNPTSVYQNYVSLGGKVVGTPTYPLDTKQQERIPSTPLIPSSNSSVSQIPSEIEMQSSTTEGDLLQSILNNIKESSKRQDIILIDDLQDTSTQSTGNFVISGGISLDSQLNEKELLYSFLKNKLLLDLNYL